MLEMEKTMPSLTDPLDLPSGLRLPNRIAKAALSEALGDARQFASLAVELLGR